MSLYQPEPVEISTRMRPGEWTESSLEELVTTYRAKILAMGAAVSEVLTEVVRNDDGSVSVSVSWNKGAYADEPEGGAFTNTESKVDTAGA
ncbi:hypothetical protein ARGLB_118_00230 [Arthrobacter globiformis NBRC 12137]|uniref:Uncharacterized protein n=1 Tax=Arthrobacter globiformis (strain ATCC 8010 / DSM 20124 / JCM 1332 / NBRC 12137 / NCIMB 8907 / NRRL B-2979 / 168) TaxID=1077972 RepID=H0QU58_ARTG1|nr:hypothetical protein [Arthrobacter globiformis]GAB16359.1 hypothetical protein ARGLB_118_00230 [Arthrobacter globiformis NBRC 12137]